MIEVVPAEGIWSEDQWRMLEQRTARSSAAAVSEDTAWQGVVRAARRVLRTYSTSFYLVTRFLPIKKREKVEVIYAAVRYPDEIVDSFPLSSDERHRRLDDWAEQYERGLGCGSFLEAVDQNVPVFLAGFTQVVRSAEIPHEFYRAFLHAMRRDSDPHGFGTLQDLIDHYIYGSAVVVGYFLTYVYGSVSEKEFARAMSSARNLGIALQLTNFLRDVGEDFRRGRIYLPQDLLREAGIEVFNFDHPAQFDGVTAVVHRLAAVAEEYYDLALSEIDAFNSDSRIAILACIKVYRRLNERISKNSFRPRHRESVPATEKLRALPASKYWRIPLAYLGK